MAVEELLFDISEALRTPILIAAVAALVLVLVDAGAFVAELVRRARRGTDRLEGAIGVARTALHEGNDARARLALRGVAWNRPMRETMSAIVDLRPARDGENRIAKRLAEYDLSNLRRLERTRILVRMGPALGLMGTLIPLSPALAGLASGDVQTLTDNLRVAFSVTVAGLLVGAVAFALSIVRDRLYAQDFSDVEFAAAALAPGSSLAPGASNPSTDLATGSNGAAATPTTAPAATAPPADGSPGIAAPSPANEGSTVAGRPGTPRSAG